MLNLPIEKTEIIIIKMLGKKLMTSSFFISNYCNDFHIILCVSWLIAIIIMHLILSILS